MDGCGGLTHNDEEKVHLEERTDAATHAKDDEDAPSYDQDEGGIGEDALDRQLGERLLRLYESSDGDENQTYELRGGGGGGEP